MSIGPGPGRANGGRFMTEIILHTKLHIPPLRSFLIPRPRLVEKLDAGLSAECGLYHRKLTLVSAPPGFGKTTLVSRWIGDLEEPAAWLSLDERDNDVQRFILYVLTALHRVDGALGRTALSLLESPQPPSPDASLALLINDLGDFPGRVTLVLDDYHVIRERGIHEALTFLLDNQPPQLHLVIVSREDPPVPLHRLRVGGEMAGVYARDLRFSPGEADRFLNETMGLHLAQDQVAALERRTEGWVAGLQLAALSLRDAPDPAGLVAAFAGDDRYITDYLMAEVIDRQPPYLQEFLLRTAICDRFCSPLCEALLEAGAPGEEGPSLPRSAHAIINHLEQSNLFIVALDNRREWYRYHHLFADFLRLRLKNRATPEVAEWHRRAAAWFAQRDATEEAIQHYLAAREYPQAAELMERLGVRLIVQGQLRKMLDWLAGLPEAFISTRPLLCVCHAWVLNVMGQTSASEPLLQRAEQTLTPLGPEQAGHIRGLIDTLRAYQARREGDLPRSTQLLSQASATLSPDDLFVRGTVNLNLGFNYLLTGRLEQAEGVLQVARKDSRSVHAVYINLIAMAVQANVYVAQGRLGEALQLYEEAIAYGLDQNRGQPFPPAGYAYAGLGQVLYEQNDLPEAERNLAQAVEAGESMADWSLRRRGLLPLAWLKQMTGDQAAAEELWRRAQEVVQQAESKRVAAHVDTHQARLWLAQAAASPANAAAMAGAADWAANYRAGEPDPRSYGEALAQLTLAWVDLAQSQPERALACLGPLAESAAKGGQIDNLIKALALQSLAHAARGDLAEALGALRRALDLGAPEGYVRTFVDLSRPMHALLRQAAAQGVASDYASRLLAAFPEAAEASPLQAAASAVSLAVEPLNDRELAILKLIAAGLSNREIASELYLSPNTIKAYASQMYAKLGVHKRAEAVTRAHELGILRLTASAHLS
jgi:LuxR family maltose regulon positive regulatory protein